eukprot:gene6400-biopygen4955
MMFVNAVYGIVQGPQAANRTAHRIRPPTGVDGRAEVSDYAEEDRLRHAMPWRKVKECVECRARGAIITSHRDDGTCTRTLMDMRHNVLQHEHAEHIGDLRREVRVRGHELPQQRARPGRAAQHVLDVPGTPFPHLERAPCSDAAHEAGLDRGIVAPAGEPQQPHDDARPR